MAVSGIGFYDWRTKQATFPPHTQIRTEAVSMDFSTWQQVDSASKAPPGFMSIRLIASAVQFEHVADAVDLDSL